MVGSGSDSFLNKFLPFKKKDVVASEERFDERKIQLEQKATIVEQGLSSVGVRTARLGTEELIELFYTLFNPGDSSGAPAASK